MNGDNSFGWNHEATLDNIHAQKYNKAYAGARLTAELKYLLQDVEYQQSIFISTNFALLQAFLMPSDSSLLHC